MDAYSTEVTPGGPGGGWTLKVTTSDGVVLEYEYRTAQQARYMAAVFALGPSSLPPAKRIDFPQWDLREARWPRARRFDLADLTPPELDRALDAIAQ